MVGDRRFFGWVCCRERTDFIAFGREYIANPDLVERIRLHAPLNEQRPEGYYGETAFGYTDYPFLSRNEEPVRRGAMGDAAFLTKSEQSSRRLQ